MWSKITQWNKKNNNKQNKNQNNSKTSQAYKDSNIFSCSKGSTGKIQVKQLKQTYFNSLWLSGTIF
jgi:hypothetical protein